MLSVVELHAVVIFTVKYAICFCGARADPKFANGSNIFTARVKCVLLFYSVINLLAIVLFNISSYVRGCTDKISQKNSDFCT